MRALLILFIVGLLIVAGCQKVGEVRECNTDADCVAASCCHADACAPVDKAPSCSGIYCSQECSPGTLDCGAGKCVCVGGKCGVDWNEQ